MKCVGRVQRIWGRTQKNEASLASEKLNYWTFENRKIILKKEMNLHKELRATEVSVCRQGTDIYISNFSYVTSSS
jgi:hypothetical protein